MTNNNSYTNKYYTQINTIIWFVTFVFMIIIKYTKMSCLFEPTIIYYRIHYITYLDNARDYIMFG